MLDLSPKAHRRGCKVQVGRKLRSLRLSLEHLERRRLLAPLPPTGLVAEGVSSSSIALAWNPSTDATVTGYDVYEKVWVPGIHNPKGSGGTPGHYAYDLRAGNLTAAADTITGLAAGTTHDYVVTALSPAGQSVYSADAAAETWIAPSLPYDPNTFLLSSGALWSSPVDVTAGLTTQLSLLASGNPLNYSVASGPSNALIDAKSGVVTFTPDASQAGPLSITFQASNALGSVQQTIQFNVSLPKPGLATPTLSLQTTTSTYNGQYQQVSPKAVGSDGATPVAGVFAVAYNGGKSGYPLNVGSYQVLATFTSADPN